MAPVKSAGSQRDPREALHFVDVVAYSRPAEQAALPPPAAEDAADHTLASYASSAVVWHSPEPALTKLHGDAADRLAGASIAGAVTVTAYPTPSQAPPARAATVGSLLDSGYAHHGAMFDAQALAAPDTAMSGFTTALTVAFGAALPATSPYPPFPAIAATPSDTHQNSKASSASPGMDHAATPHMHHDMAPAMSAMLRPIPRPLEIHPLPTMPSFDEFTSGSRIAMTHSEPATASIHGAGMGCTGSTDSGIHSADVLGFGLATRPSSSGNKDSSAMFPSLLYRICEDPLLNDISYWGEKNFVCIPDMEKLRLKLNELGMTANHTDSLQKNFNDYQFKRQTDQRRIRHTNERAIVKFSNDNFLPGREDLLINVVRKSAIKKNQTNGARDRQAGQPPARRRARVPSIRQGGRGARQSASERAAPYARHPAAEHSPIAGFAMPISPTGSFPAHQGPASASMQPLYTSGEMPGLMMPLGVPGLSFSIPHTMPLADRADVALLPVTAGGYSQAQLYIEHAPGLVVPGLMQPPPMGLSASFHAQYPAPFPPRHHAHQPFPPYHHHQEHSPQQMPVFAAAAAADPLQHSQTPFPSLLHHDPSQHAGHAHHQYQVFPSPGDMSSHPTPPNGMAGENHST